MARGRERNVFANSPEGGSPGNTSVIVESAEGRSSHQIAFVYGGACHPLKFTRTEWKTDSNTQVEVGCPTAAVLYLDGRLDLGSEEDKFFVVT